MNSAPVAREQREESTSEAANLQLVTARSCSAIALIVDHDVGFLMWLGEMCTELGCQAVPALHCRQALTLASRLELPITTLVINPELRGAARTVKTLLAANPDMRVVAIRGSSNGGVPTSLDRIQARCTLHRPSPWETISRPEWVAKVRKMLI
jgi:hypothetical protein